MAIKMYENTIKTIIYCPYGLDEPVWVAFGFVKKGKKYFYVSFETDIHYAETIKLEIDKTLVFDGKRLDILMKYENWKKVKNEYHTKREEFRNNLETELNKKLNEQLEKWDKENPYPTFNLDGISD
ncbi:MAG: hypothetical protein QXO57_02640 [Candidatus Aenigmatarchaeota archaeon]